MEDYLLRVAEYKEYVWVLLGVFLFALVLQLYFYFRYYSGIFRFKNRIDKNDVRLSTNKPAVSVIICARNESENLARFLPAVLKQKYPKFEVIVVNDGSTDESTDLLKKMTEQYPNLYQTFLPMGAKYMSRKKMCVTVGIKAAHYDHLLLVDADCEPASDQWIANIMRHYASGTSVVLGYTGYKGNNGFLDNMIAYDMMFEAMRFMGFALQKKPYRGVSGNLSYSKELFSAKKGFTSHLILSYGDDDLLIRDIATKQNTAVCVEPEAVTWSHRDLTMNSFLYQREKQMETYAEYLPSTKFRISSEIISRYIFYLLALVLLVMFAVWTDFISMGIVAFLFLIRLITQLVVFTKTSNALTERKFTLSIVLYDIILPLITLHVRTFGKIGEKKNAMWKQ